MPKVDPISLAIALSIVGNEEVADRKEIETVQQIPGPRSPKKATSAYINKRSASHIGHERGLDPEFGVKSPSPHGAFRFCGFGRQGH